MQREAAARLDAFTAQPQLGQKTARVGTFKAGTRAPQPSPPVPHAGQSVTLEQEAIFVLRSVLEDVREHKGTLERTGITLDAGKQSRV